MNTKNLSASAIGACLVAAFSLTAYAQPELPSAEMKAAMEKCRQEHPAPARPERGTRPTEAQRQQFETHMSEIKACLEAAGFSLPDRPPRGKGPRNHQPPEGGESFGGAEAAR